MKAIWLCGLLALLAIVAYSRFSIAPSDAGEPLSAVRASPSIVAPPSAPDAVDNGGVAATNLAAYVYLHETRNATNVLQAAAHTNACP